jgi:penicillin-binding protein 2
MRKSIQVSCNTYYYQLGNDMGIDRIHDFMQPFGFGEKTGIDLAGEKTGVLPSKAWKIARFKGASAQKWVGGDTISVSNGSGYNNYTPLQVAQATAILANNGVVMKPHLVKSIEDAATRVRTLTVPKESSRIALKQSNIDIVKDAMMAVAMEEGGTAFSVFRNAGYTLGGKTGTAQVVGIKKDKKYDAKALAERLRDHAWFTAFAPADKPRIVIAVLVENGGWGAGVAAPIARKALDYYLLGKRPNDLDPVKVPNPANAKPTPEEADQDHEHDAELTPPMPPEPELNRPVNQ